MNLGGLYIIYILL